LLWDKSGKPLPQLFHFHLRNDGYAFRMIPFTIVIGILLNIVGLVGFFGTGAIHYTALIPCALGLLLILCGILARIPRLHMHAMHLAVLIALLGFGATVSSFSMLGILLQDSGAEKGHAAISKMSTALLCGIFVVFCIRSFVVARLARKAGKQGY
jgi:hypothetical protein